MSNEVTCIFCGSAVERGSEFCQNCGAALNVEEEATSSVRIISESQPSPPVTVTRSPAAQSSQSWQISQSQPTRQPSYYQQPSTTVVVPRRQDNTQGNLALIFAILSCVGVLPCIGSILAISIGNKNPDSSNASIAVTLGWISICTGIIVAIIFITLGFWW